MSEIKERIVGALSIMSDEDAESVWAFIRDGYVVKTKTWDDIDEDEPDAAEMELIKKYNSDPTAFAPVVTHDDLRKQIGE